MSYIGKAVRLERLINRKTHKTVIIPMDHGLSVGTISGLENMAKIVNEVAEGGANAVIEHAGMAAAGHRGGGRDIGLIIHLSGATNLAPDPNYKVIVCSVEDALRMGADGVSIHINIGANDEPQMFMAAQKVVSDCRAWGMPIVGMMYPRGKKIQKESDPDVVNIAARAGAELGMDIVKTNYTGDIETFRKIVKGVPVPIIIAGGPKMDTTEDVFQMIHDAVIEAGAMGVAMGRNVFQSKNPRAMVGAICKIVHENYTVQEALKEYPE